MTEKLQAKPDAYLTPGETITVHMIQDNGPTVSVDLEMREDGSMHALVPKRLKVEVEADDDGGPVL